MGFKPIVLVSVRAKTVHALDHLDTVTGGMMISRVKIKQLRKYLAPLPINHGFFMKLPGIDPASVMRRKYLTASAMYGLLSEMW
jgi:hypothetical protein